MCMHVVSYSEVLKDFCVFSLTKMWKVGQKSFFKWAHFEIWFPKKEIIEFYKRKFELHKKDTIVHNDNGIFPKQEETKTRGGPIWVPLKWVGGSA